MERKVKKEKVTRDKKVKMEMMELVLKEIKVK